MSSRDRQAGNDHKPLQTTCVYWFDCLIGSIIWSFLKIETRVSNFLNKSAKPHVFFTVCVRKTTRSSTSDTKMKYLSSTSHTGKYTKRLTAFHVLKPKLKHHKYTSKQTKNKKMIILSGKCQCYYSKIHYMDKRMYGSSSDWPPSQWECRWMDKNNCFQNGKIISEDI